MSESITKIIEDFIERQHPAEPENGADPAVPAARRYNHNVFDRRLREPSFGNHKTPPYCIYFYYIRVDCDGRLTVKHYFWPGGDPNDPNNPGPGHNWVPLDDTNRLKTIIRQLAENARPSGTDMNPPPIGDSFYNIKWRRRSWIVFFIDEVSWDLFKRQPGERRPRRPSVTFTSNSSDPTCTSNESFFDAEDFDIEMPINGGSGGTDFRTAVAFINHMKEDHAGTNAQGTLPYKFNIFLEVGYAGPGGGANNTMKVIFDPGGENDGPPLEP